MSRFNPPKENGVYVGSGPMPVTSELLARETLRNRTSTLASKIPKLPEMEEIEAKARKENSL